MAIKYYTESKLSDRIAETPEGFLVCLGVPIARTGDHLYAPGETSITPGGSHTVVSRTVDDIHDPATIASFEGKPVTLGHPEGNLFVTSANWRSHAVGFAQHVRPGDGDDADKLVADLLITDAEAIAEVRDKRLREVSCAYEAEYIEDAPGLGRQRNIRGNHVALVSSGRCGPQCAIFDTAHNPEGSMMGVKEKLMSIFSRSLDEALIEDAPAPVTDKAPPDPEPDKLEPVAPDFAAQFAAMQNSIETLQRTIAQLAERVPEPVAEAEATSADTTTATADEACPCTDGDIIARAEILAPGIAKVGDVKSNALTAAYGTEDGRAAIDLLLGGRSFDAADTDTMFVAASELLKLSRTGRINNVATMDTSKKRGPLTPDEINELNAKHYAKGAK